MPDARSQIRTQLSDALRKQTGAMANDAEMQQSMEQSFRDFVRRRTGGMVTPEQLEQLRQEFIRQDSGGQVSEGELHQYRP